jgi:hypothetical protein
MEKQFCGNCGNKLEVNAKFCDNCGQKTHEARIDVKKIVSDKLKDLNFLAAKLLQKIKGLQPTQVFVGLFLLIGFFAAIHFYQSYVQTQQIIAQTSIQLQETQAKLSDIASSTSQRLVLQDQELSQKAGQITKLETDLKNSSGSNSSSGNVGGNLISSFAPSVVKVICYSDVNGNDLQLGSGVLYHSSDADPSSYFVETNLHVIKTSDGSNPQCAFAVYPNYANTSNYLIYNVANYKLYQYGVDFTYLIPGTSDSQHAGTMAQLSRYAKNIGPNTFCKTSSIGEHISILGYPGVGGSSLTATDGIIAGFESDNSVRYIKTSAKIEHGNSGGVAIKDSGCVVGIPTYVETGAAESIGRILDLGTLFSGI